MAAPLFQGRVALVACSNGLSLASAPLIEELIQALRGLGLEPVCSPLLYAQDGPFAAPGAERAMALESFYRDDTLGTIFDVSGGDLCNELLSELDLSVPAAHPKPFFGYSDLTVLHNALYAATGREGWLYRPLNLTGPLAARQQADFAATVLQGEDALLRCRWGLLQGDVLDGVVVGGNISCFLKLAGTPYWPDLAGKLLLLEAQGGEPAFLMSCLQQLRQLGAFDQIAGVLLGTFVTMEEKQCRPTIEDLLRRALAGRDLPIARTPDIGHRPDSKAIVIGRRLRLQREGESPWAQGPQL